MFEADSIKKLNDLEILAFDYINREPKKVQDMTIRELAHTIHTSTTTIVRMSNKLGFKGWSELKYYLRQKENGLTKIDDDYEPRFSLDLFWKELESSDMQERLDRAVKVIAVSKYTVFLGLGSSDAIGQYGARFFNNLGLSAFTFNDIFRPVSENEFSESVVIVLSVSGETPEVVEKALAMKHAGAFLIVISNNGKAPLSRMANINLSYNVPKKSAVENTSISITTQLPVIALLELLAYRTHQISNHPIIL